MNTRPPPHIPPSFPPTSTPNVIPDAKIQVLKQSSGGATEASASIPPPTPKLSPLMDAPPIMAMDEGWSSQSGWATLPPELLRDICARVDESETEWPQRQDVVACAGVCRNWRWIMKGIVKPPEVSGKLTFPISLKQPGPRDAPLQCFIRRDAATQTYYLYLGLTNALEDDGKFLLAARRFRLPTCSDFIISLNALNLMNGSGRYVGKLRFTLYDTQPPHAGTMVLQNRSIQQVMPTGDYRIAQIAYEVNQLGSSGPRRMHCVIDSIPADAIEPGGMAPRQSELLLGSLDSLSPVPFLLYKSFNSANLSGHVPGPKTGILVLKNKDPRWHEQLMCWCLNFRGRVTVASVKNFQLVAAADNSLASAEHEKVLLQFGKAGKDLFTMDYQYPLSAFQAFAICLSSFETKIACE